MFKEIISSVICLLLFLIIAIAMILICYFLISRNKKAAEHEKINFLKHTKLAEDELRSAEEDIKKLQDQKKSHKELIAMVTNNIELGQEQYQAVIDNAKKEARLFKLSTNLAKMRGENLDKDIVRLKKQQDEYLKKKESPKEEVEEVQTVTIKKSNLLKSVSIPDKEIKIKDSQQVDENWDDPKNRGDVTDKMVDKTRKRKTSLWTKVKTKLVRNEKHKPRHSKHLKFMAQSDETSQDGMEEVDGMSECSSYTSSAVKNLAQHCHRLDDAASTFTDITAMLMARERQPKHTQHLSLIHI